MISKYYKYFRWLSLDIVLGAIIFLAFLEDWYGLDLSPVIYWELSAAIWLIYTVDHLIDARKSHSSSRRAFHYQHFNSLILIGGLVLITSLLVLPLLPLAVLKNGAILAAGCVLYLLMVYFIKGLWVKELLVAFGYAFGVFLAPVSELGAISPTDFFLCFHLALIALINLLIFSYFDKQEDKAQGFDSTVLKLGSGKAKILINVLLTISLLLTSYTAMTSYGTVEVAVVYGSMTALLGAVFWIPKYFSVNERFRVLGDAVFFTPIFFLW